MRVRSKKEYTHVVNEYSHLADQYDLSCQRFLSTSRAVALEVLNPQSGERILDAGCGTGSAMMAIAKSVGENGEAVGIDLSEDMLGVARKKLSGHSKAIMMKGNLDSISYPDNYFDAIMNFAVMHYFHDISLVLTEFYRLLKPGGRLVLVGFCTDYFFFALIEKIWRIFTPSHIRAYSLDELSRKAKETGFEIVEGKRFKIGWFWRSMVLKGRKP